MDGITPSPSTSPEPSRKRKSESPSSSSVSSVDLSKQFTDDELLYSKPKSRKLSEAQISHTHDALDDQLVAKFVHHVFFDDENREPKASITGYIAQFKQVCRFNHADGVSLDLLERLQSLKSMQGESDDEVVLKRLIKKEKYNHILGIEFVRDRLDCSSTRTRKKRDADHDMNQRERQDIHSSSPEPDEIGARKVPNLSALDLLDQLPEEITESMKLADIAFNELPIPQNPSKTLLNLRTATVRMEAVIRVTRLIADHAYKKSDAVSIAQLMSKSHWKDVSSLNQSLFRWFKELSISDAKGLGLKEEQLEAVKNAFTRS
ncbi:hypothetical protein EOPP23_11305 [Endozoicomonas sp. OPT23]|uniref:hypothetical protein n=1 Tax=Endozoicomonas sp. OPT23 TaxID=2072845 RepID=UPI00129B12FB|nr:hypothetical protein [Endozoicomonas sp. OPT23]MRI33573.1 hypothetical protein [Endozoicomonas sp. OPT23]